MVKADGYGHGAIAVRARPRSPPARRWLGVALVEEGAVLRKAGIERARSCCSPNRRSASWPTSLGSTTCGRRSTRAEAIARRGQGRPRRGRTSPLPVHLKVDTGMNRVGAAPDEALRLAKEIAASDELELEGAVDPLAVADEPAHDAFTDEQLDRFDDGASPSWRGAASRRRCVHAANSGGRSPIREARYDLVRGGIALYGIAPRPRCPRPIRLRPAMSLAAEVSIVKRVRRASGSPTACATCSTRPSIGGHRADRLRRRRAARLGLGRRRGAHRRPAPSDRRRRHHGPAHGRLRRRRPVAVGDEVVLLGRQGDEMITAEEWAERLDTIAYEIVCGIASPACPRRYRTLS